MPSCDVCPIPATHGTFDNRETAPGKFQEDAQEKRGCPEHPVTSMCYFLDGHVEKTADVIARFEALEKIADVIVGPEAT